MTHPFEPFIVRVEAGDEGACRVTAEFRGASWSEPLPADLGLAPAELAAAQDWLGRSFVDRAYARACGQRLFGALFTGKVLAGFRMAYERVAPEAGLRILLSLPPELAAVPWELLCDDEGGLGFLARSAAAPLVRHLPQAALPNEPPAAGPLRVLLIAAAPSDLPPVAAVDELAGVQASLAGDGAGEPGFLPLLRDFLTGGAPLRNLGRGLQRSGRAEIEVLPHATRARLQRCMARARDAGRGYHVVHFTGHAAVGADEAVVFLETAEGRADPVSAADFAELIAEPSVNLIVLNACQTATPIPLFGGVAEAALRRGVPAVIAMQMPIVDAAALQFAREFYAAWADGEPVEGALATARRLMIAAQPGAAADWGIPVLFMAPPEGVTLPRLAPEAGRPRLPAALRWAAGADLRVLGDLDEGASGAGSVATARRPADLRSAVRTRVAGWRGRVGQPTETLEIDAWDPLARLVRGVLRWEWAPFLVVMWIIYGPVEKLLIPGLLGFLNLGGGIRTWVPDVESLLTGFVEFPFFLAFYMWTGRGIGDLFLSLARNRSFADMERYETFLHRAQRHFDRLRWTLLSLAVAGGGVLAAHFILWGPNADPPPWFGQHRLIPRIVALALIGLVAYAMAQIVIREILAVTWLRRLWREMGDDLVVHPYHADQAGGLGAIGHHAVMLSILVLMVMLFIIMGSLLPSLRGSGPITLRIWSPLIILLWLIYFTLVPAIFASLIWPAHRRMQEAAEEQINLVSGQLDDRLTAAQSQAASDHGQLPATMGIIGEMKKLHVLLGEDFPTWPLSAAARRRLPLTSLIPLAYSILTAVLDLIARLRS